MNAPMCAWSLGPRDSSPCSRTGVEDIAWWCRRAQQHQRWRRMTSRHHGASTQGRDVAEKADSLIMNLRQTKRELVTRDEEVRRLRLAVVQIENTLSQREREFHDTVLCLKGELPPKSQQEWMQKGASSSTLRLQVHRLQRTVAAKQDHIDHLNRQASLGFLREAQEQAKEYRLEIGRLNRALAAATGGIGRAPLRTAVDNKEQFTADVGVTAHSHGTRAYQTRGGSPSTGKRDVSVSVSTLSPLGTQPSLIAARTHPLTNFLGARPNLYGIDTPTQNRATVATQAGVDDWPQHTHPGREAEKDGQAAASELQDMSSSLHSPRLRFRQTGGQKKLSRLFSPQRPYSVDSQRNVRRAVPSTPPRPRMHACGAWDTLGAEPLQRSSVRSPYRSGYGSDEGEGSYTHISSRGLAHDGRMERMAETARLRSEVREAVMEKNHALALSAESRRLQTARARRARRARQLHAKIARYRKKRLSELQTRLNRRGDEEQHRSTDAQSSIEVGDRDSTIVANGDDGIPNNNQVTQSSKPRRELEAAIVSADTTSANDHLQSAFAKPPPESPGKQMKQQHEHGVPINPRDRRPAEMVGNSGIDVSVDNRRASGSPNRPIGKPPLLPSSRKGRPFARMRRSSWQDDGEAVNSIDWYSGVGGTGIVGRIAWNGVDDGDADEVETEAASNGSEQGIDALWGDEDDETDLRKRQGLHQSSFGWDGQAGTVQDDIPFLGQECFSGDRNLPHNNFHEDVEPEQLGDFGSRQLRGEFSSGIRGREKRSLVSASSARRWDEGASEVEGWHLSPKQGYSLQDQLTIPPYRGGLNRAEGGTLRMGNDGNSPRTGATSTMNSGSSHVEHERNGGDRDIARKVGRNTQSGSNARGVNHAWKNARGASSTNNVTQNGIVRAHVARRDEDLAYRDPVTSHGLRGLANEDDPCVPGEIHEEKPVMLNGGVDVESWEVENEGIMSPQKGNDGTVFGDKMDKQLDDGDSYYSRWSLSVDENIEDSENEKNERRKGSGGRREGGEASGQVAAAMAGLTKEIELPMPECQDNCVEMVQKQNWGTNDKNLGLSDNRESFFAVSPTSDEEAEALQTSTIETDINTPPTRSPVSQVGPRRVSTASRQHGERASFTDTGKDPSNQTDRRKRSRQPTSRNESLDQCPMSLPRPCIIPETSEREGAKWSGAGINDRTGEGKTLASSRLKFGESGENASTLAATTAPRPSNDNHLGIIDPSGSPPAGKPRRELVDATMNNDANLSTDEQIVEETVGASGIVGQLAANDPISENKEVLSENDDAQNCVRDDAEQYPDDPPGEGKEPIEPFMDVLGTADRPASSYMLNDHPALAESQEGRASEARDGERPVSADKADASASIPAHVSPDSEPPTSGLSSPSLEADNAIDIDDSSYVDGSGDEDRRRVFEADNRFSVESDGKDSLAGESIGASQDEGERNVESSPGAVDGDDGYF